MTWTLYVATFPHGKRYFGVTSKSLDDRISSHKRTGGKRRTIFHKALSKYGDAVAFEVVATGDRSYILYAEYRSIERHQTRERRSGYNEAFGGALSPMLVPEIAKKNGETKRGRKQPAAQATLEALAKARAEPGFRDKSRAGIKAWFADETNMAAHRARTIAHHADPIIKKIVSERARARASDPNSRFGKGIMSDETKAQHAAQLAAMNQTPEARERQSNVQSERWQRLHADPDFAAATKARMEKMNNNPEFKEAARERMRERWKDPAFRERMRLAQTGKPKS